MIEADVNYPHVYWITSKTGEKTVLDFRRALQQDSLGKIGLLVSGGIDSTALLYLVCKIIKDNNYSLTVHPYTWRWTAKGWSAGVSTRAVKMITELLEVDFVQQHEYLDFGSQYEEKFGFSIGRWKMEQVSGPVTEKINENKDGTGELRDYAQRTLDILWQAKTANPNDEEFRTYVTIASHDQTRNVAYRPPVVTEIDSHWDDNTNHKTYFSSPFQYCDKRICTTVFEHYGLDSILPYTRSCELLHRDSNNFQLNCSTAGMYVKPNGMTTKRHRYYDENTKSFIDLEPFQCWWCKEREWSLEGSGMDPHAWIPLPEMTDDSFVCSITGAYPQPKEEEIQ